MKIIAIIQARMGSTRLPGKVLQDIGGETMLARVARRTQRASLLDGVLVATTTQTADDAIAAECGRLRLPVYRGSEDDVLDRYYQAAQAAQADAVARITSDCPFIDPAVIDKVVSAFLRERPDYASNFIKRTYPRGLDTEIMRFAALEQAWREAAETYQRAHVTPYIHQQPDKFRLLSVENETDASRYRWTVDTADDLAFARAVYRRLGNDDSFGWLDALALLRREPELAELNRHIQQKSLHAG